MNDFLNLLIDTGWLQTQFDTNPRNMWAFTAFVLVLGIASGAGLTAMSGWVKTKRETKIRALELEHERLMQRERDEAIERGNIERLQSLPSQLKSILKETYDNGTMLYKDTSSVSDYAITLLEMKLLYPVGSTTYACEFMVTPDTACLIRAHYDEIFG